MEYVGGRSLKQHPEGPDAGATAARSTPLPRRPGDRLHRRDPAGVLVPARHGAALLRLQARQRDPGRRRAQAHRPRRRAPARRRRQSPIYGTVGFQAPEVADDRPDVAERHLHRRPHAGRARRSSSAATRSTYVDVAARRRRRAAVPAHDSLYRLLAQGDRTRPGRPLPVGRRDARPAARRAARGRRRRPRDGRPRPLDAVGAVRARRPSPVPTRPGATCRRSRVDPADAAAAWLAGRVGRRTPSSGARALEQAPEQTRRGAAGQGTRRDRGRARSTAAGGHRRDPRREPVGVARRLAAGPRRARRGRRRRARSTRFNTVLRPGAGRARAEARPGAGLRAHRRGRRRRAALRGVRRDRRRLRRAGGIRPRPHRAPRRRLDGALDGLDLVAADQPRVRRGPPASAPSSSPPADRGLDDAGARRPSLDGARHSTRERPAAIERPREHPSPTRRAVAQHAADPTVRDRPAVADRRAACARGARAAPTATLATLTDGPRRAGPPGRRRQPVRPRTLV